MKKFLTDGKIQQKYSGTYEDKHFPSFSSFFEREAKENFHRFKLWISFYLMKHFMEAQN